MIDLQRCKPVNQTYMSNQLSVEIKATCPFCNGVTVVNVPKEGYDEWQSGTLIQAVFPDMDEDTRELLISGVCAKCWEELFSEDEDEDEDESED